MKKICIFILFILFSCQQRMVISEQINPVTIQLATKTIDQEELIHYYFKNLENNDYSTGILINPNAAAQQEVILYPGPYAIYVYGLITKDQSVMQVYSYTYQKKLLLQQNEKLSFHCKLLYPQFSSCLIEKANQVNILIYFNDISDLFSLSSVSIQQGEGRKTSYDFEKIDDQTVFLTVPVEENGKWLMNNSLAIKSKWSKEIFLETNLNLSTSYFSNLYLGTF
ncbi:MAG: hypothetical protein MJB14_09205 [Spirochaetes bacterium]|nr:hypothetical protein [Spirochaetota bacterium]